MFTLYELDFIDEENGLSFTLYVTTKAYNAANKGKLKKDLI